MKHEKAPNPYISRFAEFQTHFLRNDPWPHIPWKVERRWYEKLFIAISNFIWRAKDE